MSSFLIRLTKHMDNIRNSIMCIRGLKVDRVDGGCMCLIDFSLLTNQKKDAKTRKLVKLVFVKRCISLGFVIVSLNLQLARYYTDRQIGDRFHVPLQGQRHQSPKLFLLFHQGKYKKLTRQSAIIPSSFVIRKSASKTFL